MNSSTFNDLPAEIKYTYLHPNGQSSLVMSSSYPGMLRLERFITALKDLWQIDETPFIKMNVALNELVTNAIVHGNSSCPEKNVYVQAVRSADKFAFMVQDQGTGFDPAQIPDPLNPLIDPIPTGQGILIARNLSDELYYAPKGNCVWMLFKQGA